MRLGWLWSRHDATTPSPLRTYGLRTAGASVIVAAWLRGCMRCAREVCWLAGLNSLDSSLRGGIGVVGWITRGGSLNETKFFAIMVTLCLGPAYMGGCRRKKSIRVSAFETFCDLDFPLGRF